MRNVFLVLSCVCAAGFVLLLLGFREIRDEFRRPDFDRPVDAHLLGSSITEVDGVFKLIGQFRYQIEGQTYELVTTEIARSSARSWLESARSTLPSTMRVYFQRGNPGSISIRPVILAHHRTNTLAFVGSLSIFVSVLLSVVTLSLQWAKTTAPPLIAKSTVPLLFVFSVPLVVLFLRYCPF